MRRILFLLVPVGLVVVAGTAVAVTKPGDLPLPADQVMLLRENPGADIGLPLGATKAYAIGRSLQLTGQSEAALVYLDRAYRLAGDSPRIATAYARSLVEAGYVSDAARVFGRLVAADPDDLEQRQQYAQLLAQSGRTVLALEEVRELRRRGEQDPGLIKFEADLLGQLGRIDEAVEVYHEAARSDPDRTEDYLLAAGLLLQKHNRLDEMADLLEEGLAADPTSRTMRVALIRYLAHNGRVDEARAQAAAGDDVRRRGGHAERPECALELAELLARWGDYEAAISVLEAARKDGFVDRETDTQLARFLLTLDRTDEASELLTEAIARDGEDAELRFLQGRALEMREDIDGALVSLQQAVALEPDVPLYRISLLRLLVIYRAADLGAAEPDEAQLALQKAARAHAARAASALHPQDAGGHMILGSTFRALGDLDRACRHFAIAGEVNENRVPAMLELGFCQQQAGKTDAAHQTLRKLHEEFPDDPEVSNSYGYFLAEIGTELELAERLVKQALQLEPDNGAYLDSLGWVYFQQARYAEAFDLLVEAANQRGDDPVILEHLGRTLARLDRRDEALGVLRRALAAGGDPAVLQPLIAELTRGG
ncbi:MAG: tetratricopeptide repeat protein [Candidatus Krumholzibacteriia bacterium]